MHHNHETAVLCQKKVVLGQVPRNPGLILAHAAPWAWTMNKFNHCSKLRDSSNNSGKPCSLPVHGGASNGQGAVFALGSGCSCTAVLAFCPSCQCTALSQYNWWLQVQPSSLIPLTALALGRCLLNFFVGAYWTIDHKIANCTIYYGFVNGSWLFPHAM